MYIDAIHDRNDDKIKVVERVNGERRFQEFPAKYTFYYKDQKGKHQSIFGDSLTRVVCKSTKDFRKELKANENKELFESDINPVFQCLSENYYEQEPPDLNIAFFDIEADFDPGKGFADPSDPFMPITAITVHLQWLETLITFAIPPKTLTVEQAQEEVSDFENTFVFAKESEMLEAFLDSIQDADILSGWNSEGYDIPYTVNRVKKVLSKADTKRFCLWNKQPKKREFEKFGKTSETYDLVGRVHLDSLELYRKYTYEEKHSYRLDAIGEIEIGEQKTVYEGTLDQLYNNDFRKFIEYNRQDVALLDKLDKKLKNIDLSNQLAHANTVLLQTTMGAVAVTEQAVINEAHNRELRVPNKTKQDEDTQAAGAYVAYPKKGYHRWIGSMDINSLYPSVIRALNMAPETIRGQLRLDYTKEAIREEMQLNKKSFPAAWENRFSTIEYDAVIDAKKDVTVNVDWENGETDHLSGAEVYDLLFNHNAPLMMSANGTFFTTEFEGVIPGILKKWYAERNELKAKMKEASKNGDKEKEAFWDKRQLIKKINLNSLYGAILNPYCRFFDKRIGQSTTLTGRQIVKHMSAEVNKVITGSYDHTGDAVIYGDTDSVSGDSIIKTSHGDLNIEDLFDQGTVYWTETNSEKEYSQNHNIQILHRDHSGGPKFVNYNYVYRHKVSKKKFKINTSNGENVIVTEDHSVMTKDNNGKLVEKKPNELSPEDKIITVKDEYTKN